MRPVFKSNTTNQKWIRIKNVVRFQKQEDGSCFIWFEHQVEATEDTIWFAFTYPYTYTMVQNELAQLDSHNNDMNIAGSIYYQRELLTESVEGRRIDLITITSVDGASSEREAVLDGCFPDVIKSDCRVHKNNNTGPTSSPCRPYLFPKKEIIFISARVHPGEVRAADKTNLHSIFLFRI